MPNHLFFLDTYALFELVRGNPKYLPYQDKDFVTTIINLAELNYGLKKEVAPITADTFTISFSSVLVAITIPDVTTAMSLRMSKKDLSIPDAIGYTIAQRLGAKFLTGDEDFRDMSGVEFVKK